MISQYLEYLRELAEQELRKKQAIEQNQGKLIDEILSLDFVQNLAQNLEAKPVEKPFEFTSENVQQILDDLANVEIKDLKELRTMSSKKRYPLL